MKMIPAAILLAAACIVTLPARAAERFDPLRAYISKGLAETGTPSVAVAVAQHGKILWEEGFGWADEERRIPATAHTIYMLASVSKPITATGLMSLVEQGKVALDRPINAYLGDAKLIARVGDIDQATVRRVANHTAGLPLHYQLFFANEHYPLPSPQETILHYGNLITAPGEHFEYSNLGYGVLGDVIARVSGQSFGDYMRQHVFAKLGMSRTFLETPAGLEQDIAIGYDSTNAPVPRFVIDTPGAGGFYSSAHDMIRFAMFHLKDHLADQARILSDASIDEMHRPTSPMRDGEHYGIGWVSQTRSDGYRVLAHGGGLPGVDTGLTLVPAEDIAVVFLANRRDALLDVTNRIMKILLPRWKDDAQAPQAARARFEPPATLIGRWHGTVHTYQSDLPVELQFLPSGDVHAKLGDQLETLVNDVEWQDGWLSGRMQGAIGTPDASRRAERSLLLSLKLRGEVLNGGIIAGGDGLHLNPSDRLNSYGLTQWVELKKQCCAPAP